MSQKPRTFIRLWAAMAWPSVMSLRTAGMASRLLFRNEKGRRQELAKASIRQDSTTLKDMLPREVNAHALVR